MIEQYLTTDSLGRPTYVFEELGSTNSFLKENAALYPHGTAVIALEQSCGKGRGAHKWVSDRTMLSLSVLIKQDFISPVVTIAAAVAVRQAIAKLYNADAGIKWTNDILVENRKVCGILCESTVDVSDGKTEMSVICGIGVNVNTKAAFFEENHLPFASSLLELCNKEYPIEQVAAAVLSELEPLLNKERGDIAEIYKKSCITLGKRVSFPQNGEQKRAVATDISESGELICTDFMDKHGIYRVNAGEVHTDTIYGYDFSGWE